MSRILATSAMALVLSATAARADDIEITQKMKNATQAASNVLNAAEGVFGATMEATNLANIVQLTDVTPDGRHANDTAEVGQFIAKVDQVATNVIRNGNASVTDIDLSATNVANMVAVEDGFGDTVKVGDVVVAGQLMHGVDQFAGNTVDIKKRGMVSRATIAATNLGNVIAIEDSAGAHRTGDILRAEQLAASIQQSALNRVTAPSGLLEVDMEAVNGLNIVTVTAPEKSGAGLIHAAQAIHGVAQVAENIATTHDVATKVSMSATNLGNVVSVTMPEIR